MGIYVKIFALMAILCAVSALPVNEVNQVNVNEPQVDLLAAEGSPISDNDEAGDELTRDKRHHRHHFGYYGYGERI